MKLILHQATLAITEIDFVPGPFRFQIEQQHLDFAVVVPNHAVCVSKLRLQLTRVLSRLANDKGGSCHRHSPQIGRVCTAWQPSTQRYCAGS